MFAGDGEIVSFNKSYRTTAEIMDVADTVAESIGLDRSELVIRHGEEVQFDEAIKDQNFKRIDNIIMLNNVYLQEYKISQFIKSALKPENIKPLRS